MPLYICEKCHAIENTALTHYWYYDFNIDKVSVLCSECTGGKWHGNFPKEIATLKYLEENKKHFHNYERDKATLLKKEQYESL